MAKEVFDLQEMAYLQRKFNLDLAPIMEMLTHSKTKMDANGWMDFVERTRLSIVAHPDQYLRGQFPTKNVLDQIVYTIFSDYLKSEQT